MKQDRPFPAVTVTKKAELALRSGHPWVYAAEITAREGDCPSGGIVDVFAPKGAWLGAGFYSAESKIGVRVLSDNANERFGPAFFERRVKYALDYRRAVMGADFGCCRLIFGEADGLPGLTVDRFSNLLCAQVLSRGTDGVKDIIYAALLEQLAAMGERIDGIYERNESGIRALEGLEQYKGWYAGAPHPESALTEICENGVRYAVDLENGQKTGFFLDQKYNRLAVARLAACSTASRTPALSPSTAPARARSTSPRWTCPNPPWPSRGKTPPSTAWRTKWTSWRRTYSTCCQS